MRYWYDLVGNTTHEQDPVGVANGYTTGYFYDALNRMTRSSTYSTDEPLLNPSNTDYAYDLVGNRLTLTDPQENVTTWQYDAQNRVTYDLNQLGEELSLIHI